MHTILEEQAKRLSEMLDHFPDSYYQGIVGKKGTKYDNALSDIEDIKSFLRLSNLACMNAVLKMVEEKMPKKRYPIWAKEWNQAVHDISTTLTEIRKQISEMK